MKSINDFYKFYQDINDDIGMVLDVAHANLNNQIKDFITHFAEKIVHMHLSDNNGDRDLHLGIGYGSIDWNNFVKLVREINYSNIVVIESTDHIKESLEFVRELFS